MKTLPAAFKRNSSKRRNGFSLIEVVLAIGIFLVTVLALVGLLGPTLQSVDEVEKTDEIASVVNTVNAFLQNSPAIADVNNSKFNNIYDAVIGDGSATIFVFRAFRTATSDELVLRVGFIGETVGDTSASIGNEDFGDAFGTIFRVVLTPSSVIPLKYHANTTINSDGDTVPQRNGEGVYALADTYTDVALYEEGYFAMEVRIFAEDPGPSFTAVKGIDELVDVEPLFTYNTAVVR